MKKLLIIALFLFTTGCHWNSKDQILIPGEVITSEHTEYLVPEVNIPPDLLADCKDLVELNKDATLSDILINLKDNTITYHDCKAKHKSLVELLSKSLNLKDR